MHTGFTRAMLATATYGVRTRTQAITRTHVCAIPAIFQAVKEAGSPNVQAHRAPMLHATIGCPRSAKE
eukprot:2281667-Alexandrium_andersonii.AAC.1